MTRIIRWLKGWTRYRKAVVALAGAVATWGGTALADDQISNAEWSLLAAAVVAALAVFAVPNTPPPGEPADPAISEQG
jgi:hypothetical protein